MSQLDNIDKIAFSTEFGNLMRFIEGSADILIEDANEGITNPDTIVHNLGYMPAVDLLGEYPSGKLMSAKPTIPVINFDADIDTQIRRVEQESIGVYLTFRESTIIIGAASTDTNVIGNTIKVYYAIYASEGIDLS